ncbi:MAG: TIGR03435 family protein [Vicinamibacterales bacterium]
MTTPITAALVISLLAGVAATAQAPAGDAAFELASIRQNISGSQSGGGKPRAGGGYIYTNLSALQLIGLSYNVPFDRIIGGPAWMSADRYDVNAIGKENATTEERRGMVRSLLRDRFQLAAHIERRDLPVYLLVVARGDGRLGPGLRRSSVDCNDPQARKKAAAAAGDSRMVCGLTFNTGLFMAGGVEVSTMLGTLTAAAGRAVLDRTGLTGAYDFELKWTPSLGTDAPSADAVSIFTAVQEQLGLKLEGGTAPLDVLVIDRIERPSEN